jgi:hypothetical protein
MVWILWPLVILTLFDGLLNLPGGIGKNFLGHYLETVPGARPDLGASLTLEWIMGILSASIVLVSLLLAHRLYVRRRPRTFAAGSPYSCSPASIWTGCIRWSSSFRITE